MNERLFLNSSPDPENESMIPGTTLYEDSEGKCECQLSALHLKDGRIFIRGDITPYSASMFASAMLYLSRDRSPVSIYINSGGGEVSSGLLMYDIMQSYKGTIDIYCIGTAASMAAVLLAGGQKGRRFILPHSRVMIHEPLIAGGMGGSATSIQRTAESILETKRDT